MFLKTKSALKLRRGGIFENAKRIKSQAGGIFLNLKCVKSQAWGVFGNPRCVNTQAGGISGHRISDGRCFCIPEKRENSGGGYFWKREAH